MSGKVHLTRARCACYKPGVYYRGKSWIRLAGALCLLVAVAMFVLGLTVWNGKLTGVQFVRYWSWCFVATAGAFLASVADMILIRRASRRARRELFQKQFGRR